MRAPPRIVRGAFRFVLRLLPRDERDELASRILDAFEEGWRWRRTEGGPGAALAFAAREWLDLTWNVVAARVPGMDREPGRGGAGGRLRMEGMGFDVKVALRGLLRSPVLVIGAVVTLGIGIGVNLALFSVLHGIVLRPLPYQEPEELVAPYSLWDGSRELGMSWLDIELLHRESPAIEAAAGVLMPGMDTRFVLSTPDGPEPVEAARVSPNFFAVLGVSPEVGSGVAASEPIDPMEPAVLLTDAAWRRRWGADPDVVGGTVHLNETAYEVAGILPADFVFQLGARPPEVYLVRTPAAFEIEDRSNAVVQPIARMAVGSTLADVQAELDRLAPTMDAGAPPDALELDRRVRTLHEHLVGDLSRPLVWLGGAAFLVLIVACANLAALFLARHTEREADQALRSALGAGGARLARVPLAEAILLGLGGGVLGLVLADAATDFVLGRIADPLLRYDGFRTGPLVLAGAAALALGAGLLFGGLPAWSAARVRPAEALRRSGPRGALRSGRASRILAGAEAAALLVLLVATGLSLRSLDALLQVDLGFETDGRAAATLVLPIERYQGAAFGELVNRIEARLEALPGVRAAGTVTHLPLDPNNWGGNLTVEGDPTDTETLTEWELASPGYFEAAGIEVLRGRPFSATDRASTPRVVVVSRTLARLIRSDGELDRVLGMRISGTGPEGPYMEVVGVVEDVRQDRVGGGPRPHMYVSHAQMFPFPDRELVVATEGGDPLRVLQEARSLLDEVDPGIVLSNPRTLESLVSRALGRPRVVTSLLGLFGAASLLLALTGIYGVTAFALARQRREIGIRACLGAARGELFGRALGEALAPVGIGATLGLVIVALVAPRVEGLLYGVEPLDPLTLVTVPLLLLGAAAATAWIPALRAARLDPVEVLGEG